MPSILLDTDNVKTLAAEGTGDRTIWWDSAMPGFGLMVTARGARSYVVQYRNQDGISRRYTIPGGIDLDKARKQAKAIQGDVAREKDPVKAKREARKAQKAASEGTFKKVAEAWLKAKGRKLRQAGEWERILNVYIFPAALAAKPFGDIKRTEITKFLDKVERERGATMSQHVMTTMRTIMNWHAARDDDFLTPFVRGMARVSIRQNARKRSLCDVELRALWATAERLQTPFARLLQFLLLTATRRNEGARMNRSELASESAWVIPAERHKGNAKDAVDFLVPLSPAAQAVLAATPVIGKKGWAFTNDGQKPLAGFSKAKRDFDKEMLATLREGDPDAEMKQWQLHDLRRTARSLMTRVGVPSRHAEMALGHVLPGIEGTYDVHDYEPEKREAFEKLAAEVDRIVSNGKNCGTSDA